MKHVEVPQKAGVGNSARLWCPRWPGTAPRWLRAAGKRASRRQEREQQRSPRPAGAPGPGHSGRGRGWAAPKVENQLSSPLLSSPAASPGRRDPHRVTRRGLPGHVCEPKSVHTSQIVHGHPRPSRRREKAQKPTPRGPRGPAHARPALPGPQPPSTVGRWAARPARGSVCPVPGTRASARLQGPPRPAPPHRAAGYRLHPVRGGIEEVIELREHAELAEQRPGRGSKTSAEISRDRSTRHPHPRARSTRDAAGAHRSQSGGAWTWALPAHA